MFQRDVAENAVLRGEKAIHATPMMVMLYITACFVAVFMAIVINYKALYMPAVSVSMENPAATVLWGIKVMAFFVGPLLMLLAFIGAAVPDILQNFRPAGKRDEIKTTKVLGAVATIIAIDLFALLVLWIAVDAVREHPRVVAVAAILFLIGIWQSIFKKEDAKK